MSSEGGARLIADFILLDYYDEKVVAIMNSYAFSLGMVGLYVSPILCGTDWSKSRHARLLWDMVLILSPIRQPQNFIGQHTTGCTSPC